MLFTASKKGSIVGSAPRDSLVPNSTGGDATTKATLGGTAKRCEST